MIRRRTQNTETFTTAINAESNVERAVSVTGTGAGSGADDDVSSTMRVLLMAVARSAAPGTL